MKGIQWKPCRSIDWKYSAIHGEYENIYFSVSILNMMRILLHRYVRYVYIVDMSNIKQKTEVRTKKINGEPPSSTYPDNISSIHLNERQWVNVFWWVRVFVVYVCVSIYSIPIIRRHDICLVVCSWHFMIIFLPVSVFK